MAAAWQEISQAGAENRRELVLQGSDISKRIEKDGLDPNIYRLKCLNYLEISGTSLTSLESDIEKLVNLTALVLCNNQIDQIPVSVGKLTKLKVLNISNNKLEQMPNIFEHLTELDTLNLSMNQLQSLPSVLPLKNLHVIDISGNELEALPEGIFDSSLEHLSIINAADNCITDLGVDVNDLPHLNILNLSNNMLNAAPTTLSLCGKLKELNLKSNKFKDRRFGKMVEQCPTKSMLDYLHTHWKKDSAASGKSAAKDTKKKKGKKGKDKEKEEITNHKIIVRRFNEDERIEVNVTPAVLSVRQYIVCCIVRDLDIGSKFKSFITLQTKLHDTICEKRQAGTIATHDLKAVKFPLIYDAKFPQHLMIVPLFKQKEVSGEKLFEDLRKEAEELRKEKKRNTFSGIHKYLELLSDKTQYPCLLDKDGTVLSFPPITNSDKSKISKDTKDILVEVTSSTSLDTCKKIMDEVLYKMLELGLGASSEQATCGASKGSDSDSEDDGVVFSEGASGGRKEIKRLIVEQVKIVDAEERLKVLYPSRTDLIADNIQVDRQ